MSDTKAAQHLDDAIRAYVKHISGDTDTITTAWILTVAGVDPDRGEVVTTDHMPGQPYITTRGLLSIADQYWRGR